jgi:hypothetical protein
VLIEVSESPTGDIVWRPSLTAKLLHGLGGPACLALVMWMLFAGGPLSVLQEITCVLVGISLVVAVPPSVLRWRLVLERDELVFVFLTTRRLPLREIVDVKSAGNSGLVFTCSDGTQESTSLLGNGLRSHRRANPTQSDLAARAVLCAAARARGEVPPVDFRLPPVKLSKRSLTRGVVVGFVLSLFLGG